MLLLWPQGRTKTKTIAIAVLACVVAVGCGRNATQPSAGVTGGTNTGLPRVRQSESPPPMTVKDAAAVRTPTSVDPQEDERKRVQSMTLIDDRKKPDQPGQPPPAN
jgi:hypothetical protein